MLELTPHLSRDAFQVRYDPSRLTVARMLQVVKDCGFTGRESKALEAGQVAEVAPDQMPRELRDLLGRAAAEGKLVLLNFHGAG